MAFEDLGEQAGKLIIDQFSFDTDTVRPQAGVLNDLFGNKEADIKAVDTQEELDSDTENIEGAATLTESTEKLKRAISAIESRLGGANLSDPFSPYEYNAPPAVMRAEFEAVTAALDGVERALGNLEVGESHPYYQEITQRRDGLLKQIAFLKQHDLHPRLYPEFRAIPTLEDGRTLYNGNGGYGQAKTCAALADRITDLAKTRTS